MNTSHFPPLRIEISRNGKHLSYISIGEYDPLAISPNGSILSIWQNLLYNNPEEVFTLQVQDDEKNWWVVGDGAKLRDAIMKAPIPQGITDLDPERETGPYPMNRKQ